MADKETNTIETKVEQVDVNLDEIFNIAPTGESVTLPEGKEEKKSFFSRKKKADTSFLNPDDSKEEVKEEEKVKEGEEETKEAATKILAMEGLQGLLQKPSNSAVSDGLLKSTPDDTSGSSRCAASCLACLIIFFVTEQAALLSQAPWVFLEWLFWVRLDKKNKERLG